ncbi:hypothetical protein HYR69_01585 [Candidatus Sumerlaeota bacterium]|nr:hypothetical protein [Candidatus Sumerlaeota bacterium]MBI3734989.1 hypothetical protein [Candidatus Sumerlaeota bacterium]
MSRLDEEELYPRDKERLLQEMDVRLRLSDIRRIHNLRHMLAPRWWEPTLVIILFAAALGLLASLFQYNTLRTEMVEKLSSNSPDVSIDKWILYAELMSRPLNRWILFWFGIMILVSVLCFQIILFRIYNFRRVSDVLIHMMEDLQKKQDELREETGRKEGDGKVSSSEGKPGG